MMAAPAEASASTPWRRTRRAVGALLFALAVLFFGWQVYQNIGELVSFRWGPPQWAVMAGSIGLCFVNILLGALLWHVLVRESTPSAPLGRIVAIFLIAQLAKYLPGNVGQHVARVYMSKKAGVGTPAAIQSLVLEAILGIGVGAVLALLAFYYFFRQRGLQAEGVHPALLGGIAVTALVLPWLASNLLNRFLPSLARKLSGGQRLNPPGFVAAGLVAALFVACFLTVGLVLKLQLQGIFGVPAASWLELTAAFSLIWMIGYLTPGAPAGLGVREVLMVLLLAPAYGEAAAIGLSVTLRVATTLGDAVAAATGLVLGRVLPDR